MSNGLELHFLPPLAVYAGLPPRRPTWIIARYTYTIENTPYIGHAVPTMQMLDYHFFFLSCHGRQASGHSFAFAHYRRRK